MRSSTGNITKCSSQRPPTQNVWASCQAMVPALEDDNLDVTDFDNLVLDDAARGSHGHHIPLFLAHQGAGDGGADG
ncbi:hypothetical protein D3C78_1847190 [compost metagenome]